MQINENSSNDAPTVARMVEAVVGCKWSLTILGQVQRGVRRPGAIERSIEGITTKVMNERLAKLVGFGVLERVSYPEVPPRVEYALTPFGHRFAEILNAIAQLQNEQQRGL